MDTEGPRQATTDHGPLSAFGYPFWLNPTTIKGTLAAAIGLFVLATPNLSGFVLRLLVGGALVISGGSAIWFAVATLHQRQRRAGVLQGVISVVAGLALLVYPAHTLSIIVRVAAVYLAVRGIATLWHGYRVVPPGRRRLDVVRAVLMVVFAGVMFFLPSAVVSSLLIVGAGISVIVGGIMIGYGFNHAGEADLVELDTASIIGIVKSWAAGRDLGDIRREEIAEGLYFEPPERTGKLVAWWVMLVLSVAIATFAIIQDSTAVVIGAMLIAPLMTPIVGAAAAIVNGWSKRMVASFALIVAGVAGAIGLAFIIGVWAPPLVPLTSNSQVTSRISPNVIDMAIAIAAGAAGAFAIVDKRVSDSIAGVAIAVALVPPLGVVGLLLQAGMGADALGAFLLFLTNLVSIILAATLVFFLTGFAPFDRWRAHRDQIVGTLGTVLTAALIILIPLTLTAKGILASASTQSTANRTVAEWLGDDSTLRVVNVTSSTESVTVVLSGEGAVPPVEDLDRQLEERIGRPISVEVEYVPTVIYRSDER